jgi:hypothetical protein
MRLQVQQPCCVAGHRSVAPFSGLGQRSTFARRQRSSLIKDLRTHVASPVAVPVGGGAASAGQAEAASQAQGQAPYDWYQHWYPVAFEA